MLCAICNKKIYVGDEKYGIVSITDTGSSKLGVFMDMCHKQCWNRVKYNERKKHQHRSSSSNTSSNIRPKKHTSPPRSSSHQHNKQSDRHNRQSDRRNQ